MFYFILLPCMMVLNWLQFWLTSPSKGVSIFKQILNYVFLRYLISTFAPVQPKILGREQLLQDNGWVKAGAYLIGPVGLGG
jgi:hypothetical protein